MGTIDLHDSPFDSETIAKLEIFEDYAQAWIPTFVMQHAPEIHIFDFFSGPGYDSHEVPGSPIRILQKINEHLGNILQKRTKIVLHLNEFEPAKKLQTKFEHLQSNCASYLEEHPKLKYFLKCKFYNKDAESLFFELLPQIKQYPSLVYLDQNGVKFISEKYLNEFDKISTTDFIYFVSSSYFKRLGGTEEFKKALEFDKESLENEEYRNIHRLVLNKIKTKLPANSKLKLFPYSIKKGTNIYGIIFGAKHYRAVDKFLSISWKRNELNGEANFDIDEDNLKNQLTIFDGKKLTKIEGFQNSLEINILNGSLFNNEKTLIYTYENGHIPQHSVPIVKKLKKEGKINYEGKTPALNYENVFRYKNIVYYKLN